MLARQNESRCAESTAEAAVEFTGVSKFFGSQQAVSALSFAISEGETVSLLGPSGCGKTTTLRMIAGFEKPNEGAITIAGRTVTHLDPDQRDVGIVFQNYALFPHLTVEENIAYGLKYRGYPKAGIPTRVSEMLDLVQLPHLGGRRPTQLSGGQQQRVALARALAFKPGVLLLDEPLSALDAKLREELRAELKATLARVGTTTIIVTHDQDEAMSLSDRLFVMNAGTIVQSGRPEAVYAKPDTPFVAEFMGRINWLHGDVKSDGTGTILTMPSGLVIHLDGDRCRPGKACLGIRPEHLRLEGPDAAPGESRISMRGEVAEIEHAGGFHRIWVVLETGERLMTLMTAMGDETRSPGELVKLTFDRAQGHLFPQDDSTGHAPAQNRGFP